MGKKWLALLLAALLTLAGTGALAEEATEKPQTTEAPEAAEELAAVEFEGLRFSLPAAWNAYELTDEDVEYGMVCVYMSEDEAVEMNLYRYAYDGTAEDMLAELQADESLSDIGAATLDGGLSALTYRCVDAENAANNAWGAVLLSEDYAYEWVFYLDFADNAQLAQALAVLNSVAFDAQTVAA